MKSASDNSNQDNNNRDPDKSDPLFDFLDDDKQSSMQNAAGATGSDESEARPQTSKRRRKAPIDKAAGKPFPVIRKPVSVKQTGALRPPRPGDPIEPPPPLTDGVRAAETTTRVRQADHNPSILDDDDFDFGDDDWPASEQWVDNTSPDRRGFNERMPEYKQSGMRPWLFGVAGLLIVGGGAAALYALPPVQSWIDNTLTKSSNQTSGSLADRSDAALTDQELVSGPESPGISASGETPLAVNQPTPLNVRFRAELSRLETLVAAGDLDEADQVLQTMDRTLFGYGAPEFTEISERITAIRQGSEDQQQVAELEAARAAAAAERIEQERRAAAEAERLEEEWRAATEAERVAQEQRAAAEAERIAQEQRAAAEAERVAQEQRAAAEAEAERLAQQRQAALEAERLAQRQRAAAEAERLAQQERSAAQTEQLVAEQAARDEAERLRNQERIAAAQRADRLRVERMAQERERLEQLELARQQRALADRQQASIEPQLSIREIAAQQREAARQQRLLDSRQRREQSNSVATRVDNNSVVQLPPVDVPQAEDVELTESVSVEEINNNSVQARQQIPQQRTAPQPITDRDLQQVYQQFSELRNAIEERDINSVLQLTERSGVRIQQVMQMFENNLSITASLRNVSTLDATGEIQGVLQITRLERADGLVTGPPPELGLVRLSAIRDGDGWSSIRW